MYVCVCVCGETEKEIKRGRLDINICGCTCVCGETEREIERERLDINI